MLHMGYVAWRTLRYYMQRTLAWGIVVFERVLEKTLHIVHEKTEAKRGEGEVSVFLQEVANHKKDLLKRSLSERVILDE